MSEDEIIDAYRTILTLVQGDPYFLDALNRLRQAAMQLNCPSCAQIALKTGSCSMCAELRSQIARVKKDRLSKMKRLSALRKKINVLEEKILDIEEKPNLDQTPKNVEIKIVETWDENDFARALTLGHFSDRGF